MDFQRKVFTITASPGVMRRIERFLALLHHNSRFGHSATFGMPLDGDGEDKVTVDPTPDYAGEVGMIGSVGGDIEIAYNDSYSCFGLKEMGSSWVVQALPVETRVPTLLKNGQIVKQRSA